LNLWSSGAPGQRQLWDELRAVPLRRPRIHPLDAATQHATNLRRCKELAELGRLSDALKALLSSGVAPVTPAVVEQLRRKHPVPPLPPVISPEPLPPSLEVTELDVAAALRSFPKGTAGGRDGFRPDYFQVLLHAAVPLDGQHFLSFYTAFQNQLLAGNAPAALAPYLASAPLTPLCKPDGGLRPIAVGEAHRRVASKLCIKSVGAAMAVHLLPLQVGVGVQNGAEAILHSVQYLLSHWEDNMYLMKLDLKNAFNVVDRSTMFEAVREVCPNIAAWVEFCYSGSSILYLGDHHLESASGVQQGDPLGPLLFSLVLQKLVSKLPIEDDSGLALKLNVWYLDDGTLVGTPDALIRAFTIITTEGPPLGLHLAPLENSKNLLWSPLMHASFEDFPADMLDHVATQAGGGITLVGAGLGSDEYALSKAMSRVNKIDRIVSQLPDLENVELQYTLLTMCVGMPRMNYQLRVSNPLQIGGAITRFDDIMADAVQNLFGNCPLTADDMERIHFPITQSGFGISLAKYIAYPAYLGSLVHSLDLQTKLLHLASVDDLCQIYVPLLDAHFNSKLPAGVAPVTVTDLQSSPSPQHHLVTVQNKYQLQAFIASRNTPREQHVVQACIKDSGSWLTAYPIYVPGAGRMSAQEWRVAAWFRLGKPIYTKPIACPCCNGQPNDIYGIHASHCAANGDLIRRHNMVRDTLAYICSLGRLPHDVESRHLLLQDPANLGEKPADILIHHWNNGRSLSIDVCIANSLQFSAIRGQNFDPMESIEGKVTLKVNRYRARCVANGFDFEPFVCGSLGGMNDAAGLVLKKLGTAVGNTQGWARSYAIAKVRKMVSFVVQKAQANSWIRRGVYGDIMLY
jgi:hypothetical protein